MYLIPLWNGKLAGNVQGASTKGSAIVVMNVKKSCILGISGISLDKKAMVLSGLQ